MLQFLCYAVTAPPIIAGNGPAVGQECVDMGVQETASTPVGYSLQLQGTGSNADNFTWAGPALNTFGAINNNQVSARWCGDAP